jgi:hypothetical protein
MVKCQAETGSNLSGDDGNAIHFLLVFTNYLIYLDVSAKELAVGAHAVRQKSGFPSSWTRTSYKRL